MHCSAVQRMSETSSVVETTEDRETEVAEGKILTTIIGVSAYVVIFIIVYCVVIVSFTLRLRSIRRKSDRPLVTPEDEKVLHQ